MRASSLRKEGNKFGEAALAEQYIIKENECFNFSNYES